MNFSRYAVYFTLPDGPLARFGASWLGWNAATGERMDPPHVDGLPAPAHSLSETPRKYGLHGTIKPPFRLAYGADYDGLRAALARLCASRPPVLLDGLALTRLGGFLALTATGDTAALGALAGDVVRSLDDFRAPLSDGEMARRRKSGLTPRQDALLQSWGYPYVMEEFRFHITLTSRLGRADAERTRVALDSHLSPLLPHPFAIDGLTLCGEDENGLFHELHRYALSA